MYLICTLHTTLTHKVRPVPTINIIAFGLPNVIYIICIAQFQFFCTISVCFAQFQFYVRGKQTTRMTYRLDGASFVQFIFPVQYIYIYSQARIYYIACRIYVLMGSHIKYDALNITYACYEYVWGTYAHIYLNIVILSCKGIVASCR